MRRWLWSALLLTLFSGCIGSETLNDAGEQGEDGGSGVVAFDGPFVAGTYDNEQREAFVAVSADGQTLLTCAHGEFERASFMYASTDAATTWMELTADPDPRAGGDCEVAISPAGVWAFLHSTVAGATIATTKDEGKTWTVNPLAAIPVNGAADRPYMDYAGERLLLAYQPGPLQPGTIGFSYSDDHAASWSVPQILYVPGATAPHPKMGGMVVGHEGTTVRVPVSTAIETTDSVGLGSVSFFAVSRDAGKTWTAEKVGTPQAAYHYPAAAQDGAGALYWLYVRLRGGIGIGGDGELWLTVSDDDGETWSEPVKVEGRPLWPRPWMHGRPDATADLLWQRDVQDGDDELVWMRVGANGQPMEALVIRPLVDFLEYTEVTHDALGMAYIAASAREETPSEIHIFRERTA